MIPRKNSVVLITGCSSGIGRALAVEFAAQGHQVFATARKIETIRDLEGPRTAVLTLDVTDAASIAEAVKAVADRAGRIDVLVNNAGFGLMGPMAEISLDDFRRQLETNVVGPLAMVQAVAPWMVKQRSGRIINVGSVSGVFTTPFSGAYCASKAALHAMSHRIGARGGHPGHHVAARRHRFAVRRKRLPTYLSDVAQFDIFIRGRLHRTADHGRPTWGDGCCGTRPTRGASRVEDPSAAGFALGYQLPALAFLSMGAAQGADRSHLQPVVRLE